MTKRPFAVFDIDGTLIRWQLYHAVVDALARAGQVDSAKFQIVRDARLSWKRRTHPASFKAYEHELVKLFDEAIQNVAYDDFLAAVNTAFNEYKDQTYTYTRDLIRALKRDGYWLFAISASQEQVVKLLADYYGFDDCGGTRYEIRDGRFTGRYDVLLRDRKPIVLRELIKKHNARTTDSIGVGDSDSDIPLLKSVEQPIAFNPDKLLFQHAQAQGWKIVLERKNMIYELESGNGTYQLAKTNA